MKRLKLFFACLLMAVLSIGQVWGADETLSCSAGTVSNNTMTFNSEHFTFVHSKGDGSAFASYSPWRVYNKNTVKITAGSGVVSIDKIEIVHSGTNYGTLSSTSGTVTMATTSGGTTKIDETSGTEITITNTASSQSRWSSIKVYYTAGSASACATPTFSPEEGAYEGTQNVTISSTNGATIYYTIDGSDPKTSGTKLTYTSAISVNEDMTIKAYAVKSELDDSDVAEAAYTITEGPDATINLLDEGWGFPTTKVVEETAYTYGGYTIKVAGNTGNGFRTYGTYFMLGQTGAYLELPVFTSPIEKIVVAGNGSGSGDVAWNIYQGETAVSTQATGCKNDVYTFDIAPANQKANVAHAIKVTNAKNLQIKTIKIYFGEAAAVDAPTISGEANFVTSTTVTLTQADADHIYYTTNGVDPTTSSTEYTAPFTVDADGTTTVKAIAVKGSDVSAVASKDFTKVTPKTTAAALRAFATSSNQNAFIQLDGWKVTHVNGNNAYLLDPSNEGVVLNNASHGYVAGDELNDELVEASVKLASGRVQLSGFTSTDITATSGTVSPVDVTDFSTVLAANQSRLITLKNATYASSTGTFSDGEHLIYFYDQFSANPTLVDGATYDVTGIVIYYNNGNVEKVQIAPRTSDDVKAQSPVVIPTAANLAALKAAERGTYILTLTNAVVSYVNGKNVFVEEGSTGVLVRLDSHSFEAGNCLNGDYQVTTEDYQGKFEITAIEPQAGAATTTAEIPLTTVSIATLNASFDSYESRRVKIVGANVTDAIGSDDRNGAINDGAAVDVYAAAGKNIITLTANDNVDIIGYPGYYNTDKQLNVWQQSDITVNSTPTPPASDYSMSFDMTRASYDAAADAQVVWNSSVVTMTVDKGTSSTKANNYIGGGYNGDTHCADSRFYPGSIITFAPASGVTITKVEWTATSNSYASNFVSATWTNAAATADGTKVTIVPSASGDFSAEVAASKQTRATAVTVYYTAESEKAKLVGSISIDNINTAVGEDDIVLLDIAATSNPNKNAISYAIESGSEYVSIVGEGKAAAFHAIAEGTATISATIPNDLGNYTGATTTFDIIVAAGPATLESIAISGEATALEYTEGQTFNPAGLKVMGHYSDNSDAEITEGITWAFDPSPLTAGTTSVSVTATVSEITSDAVVVNGLTVSAAPTPVTDNVVILATYGTTLYAMTNTLGTDNKSLVPVEVEEDGANIVVPNAEAKAAIQWTKTTTGDNVTFQDADNKYLKGASDGGDLTLNNAVCNWTWDETTTYHCYAIGERSFIYRGSTYNVFKNYKISNITGNSAEYAAVEVRVIDPENIIVTSKVSAELAYNPTSDEITKGEESSWSAPALVNPHTVTITSYASDNESVATVEGGVIALAGGIGTAHITAHFAGNASYFEGDAVYTITVNAPAPTPTSTIYRKVTATEDITDGEYLIVYEGDATHDAAVFDGSLNNDNIDIAKKVLAVEIENDEIAGNTELDAAVFTIDVTAGSLQSASGLYIGRTNYDNGMDKSTTEAYVNTFAIAEGEAVITGVGGCTLRYNYASDQLRFRYYKSGQKAIQLYKKVEDTPVEPEWENIRTEEVAPNAYYTMCLDKAVTAVQGASIWKVISKAQNDKDVILEEVTTTVAGRPYIFFATVANPQVQFTGNPVNGPVNDAENNGLVGSFSHALIENVNTNYIIYNNELYYVNTDNVYVGAHRAYIDMTKVPAYSNEPQQGSGAPRRRVVMTVHGEQTATGMENVQGDNVQCTKVLIDGNIYILRGEKMYDATGKLVK